MSDRIDAIFDDGVLRPLAPLNLPNMARVRVTVDAGSEGFASEIVPKADVHTGNDFETELDALLFSGPTLPPDFSRADIYADHD